MQAIKSRILAKVSKGFSKGVANWLKFNQCAILYRMVKHMRYLLAYLNDCEESRETELDADTEDQALLSLEQLVTSQDYVPVGVRLAA